MNRKYHGKTYLFSSLCITSNIANSKITYNIFICIIICGFNPKLRIGDKKVVNTNYRK